MILLVINMYKVKLKKIYILIFIIINTIFIFGSDVEINTKKPNIFNAQEKIRDEIGLLDNIEKISLKKRLDDIEQNQKIRYFVLITEEPYDFNRLPNIKNILVINIYKKDNYTLNIKMKFSENINISSYKNEIENLLERVNVLVSNEYYLDLIYELTGNLNDIMTFIKREEAEIQKAEFYKKIKIISFNLFLFFAVLTIILMILKKVLYKKITKCKYCRIDMEFIKKDTEKNNEIKIYRCKICGYVRKITSFRY